MAKSLVLETILIIFVRREERKSQAAEYEQFILEQYPIGKGCGGKSKNRLVK